MFEYIKKKAYAFWDRAKAFFERSLTVFWAWVVTSAGAATAMVGYMDWSPLWTMLSTGTLLSKTQLITIGFSVVGMGVTTYLARKRTL